MSSEWPSELVIHRLWRHVWCERLPLHRLLVQSFLRQSPSRVEHGWSTVRTAVDRVMEQVACRCLAAEVDIEAAAAKIRAKSVSLPQSEGDAILFPPPSAEPLGGKDDRLLPQPATCWAVGVSCGLDCDDERGVDNLSFAWRRLQTPAEAAAFAATAEFLCMVTDEEGQATLGRDVVFTISPASQSLGRKLLRIGHALYREHVVRSVDDANGVVPALLHPAPSLQPRGAVVEGGAPPARVYGGTRLELAPKLQPPTLTRSSKVASSAAEVVDLTADDSDLKQSTKRYRDTLSEQCSRLRLAPAKRVRPAKTEREVVEIDDE